MPTARIMLSSVPQGGWLEIAIQGVDVPNSDEAHVALSRISDDYTGWAFSGPGLVQKAVDGCTVRVHLVSLEPGLYALSEIRLPTSQSSAPFLTLQSEQLGIQLLEVRAPTDQAKTVDQLQSMRDTILQRREEEFRRGLGDGPNEYWGLVFMRDCLLTRSMRLGRYEVAPASPLGRRDEVDAVQSTLANINLPPLNLGNEVVEGSRNEQPSAVVHFPRLKAMTLDQAVAMAESEAERLALLLSLHRGGYGSLFASIIVDRASGTASIRLGREIYTGNLMGGLVSGEDPSLLARQVGKVRVLPSPPTLLYLQLLREAMREKDSEFKCFRLWNILETIARAKDYIGSPLIDWTGDVVRNRKGQNRIVQDRAEELVLHLLRSVLPPRGLNNRTYASVVEQGTLDEQVPIWYRRRNCVTHGGVCLCRNPNLSIAAAQYVNCKRARDEVTGPGRDDGYLRTLRDVVVAVVASELD